MTTALRVLVVDDEPPARSRLRRMLESESGLIVVDEAATGTEAVTKAQALAPDVVFLDIRMPGMDGLEAAHHIGQLDPRPAVIFTTAYDHHALKAFELQALDYLLKPIRSERLRAALARVRDAVSVGTEVGPPPARPGRRTYLSVRIGGDLRLVPVHEVRFLRADRKYIEVGTGEHITVLDESLVRLERELGDDFVRIHRSTLVNARYVIALRRTAKGGYQVELSGVREPLDVSRRMVAAVRARLTTY